MRTNLKYVIPLCCLAVTTGWFMPPIQPLQQSDKLSRQALRIHTDAIVVDTHSNVASRIIDEGFDLGERSDDGHMDIPRMQEGGIDAEFFVISFDPRFGREGGAARRALEVVDSIYQQVGRHPASLELATSAGDIRRIAKQKKIAVLMGLEGGDAIEGSLGVLRMFYRLGVRYMSVTRSELQRRSGSARMSATTEEANAFRRQLVQEMNRVGMLVDVSHATDETFAEILEATRAPVIASNSAARSLTNVPGNLSDDMLVAVAKNGGVVMARFGASSVDQNRVDALRMRDRIFKPALLELQEKFTNDPQGFAQARDRMYAAFELPKTPLSKLVDHIDHMAKVAGVDHVGLGSGFDGVQALPQGLEDCSRLPQLTHELLKRGYAERDIRKILGENVLRVMERATTVSGQMLKGQLAQSSEGP